ncbi:hypothetical protein CC2G_003473 [Coprinopsis cinerea AmutBmut pab1-1]|nr:hypothetical protein CC2G_003473 [Coprinopsis cinerea AmutBmut pab1-1]
MAPGHKHVVKKRERVELYRCRLTRGGKKGRSLLKLIPHTPTKKHLSLSPRKHSLTLSRHQNSSTQPVRTADEFDQGEFVQLDFDVLGTSGSKPNDVEEGDGDTPSNWTDNDDFTFGAKPAPGLFRGAKVLCIVHTNGVHYLPFVFCRCPEAPSDEIQLLRHSLFPATFRDIRTAFTHALLDDYLLEMLECFTSTHHYYSKLRRMTNKSFPDSVPDRTRELRRAGRQWRRLKDLKRHGIGHTNKTPGRGEMALFCAACPQPGINLPDNWRSDPEDWKYQRSLVADGNFVCVHRKQKNQGEGDVFLKKGEGFMTERTRYKAHLKEAEERKEPQTCHEHRAIADRSKGHKGCDVTGIGAFACMRHGCFAPGSVVDFQKGERQVNMDYGFCEALKTTHTDELSKVLLVYDINCQYSKHLFERIEEANHLDINEKLSIIFGIGLFHVHGHQDTCFARYALTFIRGAGMSAGEILEPLWSVINLAAGPTSMMTLAQRDEVLDDMMADNNWKKLLGLVPGISKRWLTSIVELAIAQEDFELLDETASDAQRRLWSTQLENTHIEREDDVECMDILNVKLNKPPSKARVQHDLMAAEQALNTGLGVTSWLMSGIKLQDAQYVTVSNQSFKTLRHDFRDNLRAFIAGLPRESLRTDQQRLDLMKRRESLQSAINTFYEDGAVIFPNVNFYELQCENPPEEAIEIEGDDDGNREDNPRNPFSISQNEPEDVDIPLPSSFRDLPNALGSAAAKELRLRVAQADDALESVRIEIGHKSYLYRSNIRLAHGKQQRLRGYAAVKAVDRSMRFHLKSYNRARWALSRLNAEPELLQRYREVRREDTRAITAVYEPNARNQRNVALSWIWTINVEGDSANSEYLEELYRVNWLRAKSRAERWREEHVLLTSEMEWVPNFFAFKEEECKAWATLTRDLPGHRAYANRQANMWRLMGAHAEKAFGEVKTKGRNPSRVRV